MIEWSKMEKSRKFFSEQVFGFNAWDADDRLILDMPYDEYIHGENVGDIIEKHDSNTYTLLISFLSFALENYRHELRQFDDNIDYLIGEYSLKYPITSNEIAELKCFMGMSKVRKVFSSIYSAGYHKKSTLEYIEDLTNPKKHVYEDIVSLSSESGSESSMHVSSRTSSTNSSGSESYKIVTVNIDKFNRYALFFSSFSKILPYQIRAVEHSTRVIDIRRLFPVKEQKKIESVFSYNSYSHNDVDKEEVTLFCNLRIFKYEQHYICVYVEETEELRDFHDEFEYYSKDSMSDAIKKLRIYRADRFDPTAILKRVNKVLMSLSLIEDYFRSFTTNKKLSNSLIANYFHRLAECYE